MKLAFSLRGYLLFLICLATFPAILFTFYVAENERNSVLARTERDALHLAHLASREHAHQIQGARELLSWLGARIAADGLRSPILQSSSFLEALLAGHPQLANVGVLSPTGEVLASAYPLPSYRSWIDNPAYLAALQSRDVTAGTYIISPIFQQPTLNHAYAVRNADEQVIAVLFDGLDLSWLSEIVQQNNLPDGFSLFVVDKEGHVLASSSVGVSFHDTNDFKIADIAALSASERGKNIEIDNKHLSHFAVAVPFKKTPGLFAVVALPYDQIVEQANTAFFRTLIGLGVLTLFVIAAVFLATELAILRGLRSLVAVVQRFGAGEFAIRSHTSRINSELASLSSAFNTMADTLAIRHDEALEAQAHLRALAGRLQVVREAEATRISRELHDEIGQVLTSLKIDLSRLRLCCAPHDQASGCASSLHQRVLVMSQQIDAAINFVRRISSDLRPSVLDRLGLVAALQWQARETEMRTGLVIQVEADPLSLNKELGEEVSVTLFRIAQEALNNVVRHAQASIVEIDLSIIGEHVVLSIHDDGIGIPEAATARIDSLGIIGMRERAALIKGEFSIYNELGQGTTVRVSIPLPASQETVHAHSIS